MWEDAARKAERYRKEANKYGELAKQTEPSYLAEVFYAVRLHGGGRIERSRAPQKHRLRSEPIVHGMSLAASPVWLTDTIYAPRSLDKPAASPHFSSRRAIGT
jgi:hypothetical protein